MYPKRRTTSGVARFGSRNGTKITGRTRGVRTTTLKRSSGSKKWNVTPGSGLVLRTVRIAACEGASIRTVRNTSPDRVVTFHFFEPLERFKVVVRTPRVRPVIFVPFRLPNLATPDVVRRFGYIFRRTLLDRALQPELDRLLTSDNGESSPGSARNRLLDHIEANLLYYSTAIISAGDPAARHAALAKLLDPSGRPLTDVVENTVLGRVGNAIALPLRSAAQLPRDWQESLAAYTARPPRVNEAFNVTLPHPGVWVTAQPHDPLQQRQADERNAAG